MLESKMVGSKSRYDVVTGVEEAQQCRSVRLLPHWSSALMSPVIVHTLLFPCRIDVGARPG